MIFRFLSFACLGLVTIFCSAQAGADQPQTDVIRSPARAFCGYNTIFASKSGGWVAVSDLEETLGETREFNSPAGFLVYNVADLAKLTDDTPMEASIFVAKARINPPRLIPIGWDGESLLFRIGSGAIGRAEHNSSQWEIETEKLNSAWRKFRIQLAAPSDLSALEEIDVQQRAQELFEEESLRRRTVHLRPGDIAFSAVDVSKNQSLLVGDDINEMVNLGHANFFWRFRLGNDFDQVQYTALGESNSLQEEQTNNSYTLPVIDQNSGAIVGRFSPTAIKGTDGMRFNSSLEMGDYLIQDAAVSGGRTFVLAESAEDLRLFIGDQRTSSPPTQVIVCTKRQFMTALNKSLGVNPSPDDLNSSKTSLRPIFASKLSPDFDTTGILFGSGKASEKKLALYYHGGPASSAYKASLPQPLNILRAQGYDVLAVEYSGSVGGGLELSRALATEPLFGFDRDAEAVKLWMNENDYKEAVLYSTSFGAAPAMVLQTAIPDMITRSAHLGPLLQLPPNGVSEKADGRFFESETGSQIQFEIGVFGSGKRRNEFVDWLAANAMAFRATKDDLFIFGELDMKTPVDSAPKNIVQSAQVFVVPKSDHRFLGSKKSTQELIAAHLIGN